MAADRTMIRSFDRTISNLFRFFFVNGRVISTPLSWTLHICALVLLAPPLGVSANYFVIIPVIVTAASFGLAGGFLAGLAALPVNLVAFAIIGRMDAAPASWFIAEISGIVLGSALGYQSDFFRRLSQEMEHRKQVEFRLLKALEEREILLGEVHHRVRNNLATIKSLVNLHLGKRQEPVMQEAVALINGRIMAMSLVHEHTYRAPDLRKVDAGAYLRGLCSALSLANPPAKISVEVQNGPVHLDLDSTGSLGLMVNEILSRLPREMPSPVDCPMVLSRGSGGWTLEIAGGGIPDPGPESLACLEALARVLEARIMLPRSTGGAWIITTASSLQGPGKTGMFSPF